MIEAAPQKSYTAPNSQIHAWAIGALASHCLIQTFGQAGNIFTIGFGISPVVIGWAMMLPRFVDAITDPYLGHLSDETHTRWGRRKPYLVGGAVFGAILMAAMWWANPHWSQTAQLCYLASIGTLFYISYGVYTMAWTAVGYELTDDYHERSRVMMWGSVALAFVALGASWCFRGALLPVFHGAIWGMRWISAGVAVIVLMSAFTAAKFCKERFTHANREHVPLLPALKSAIKNRPFVILLLLKLSDTMGGRLAGAMMGYLGLYLLCSGDKVLSTTLGGLGGTIGTVCTFAILPFMKPLSVKIGKRAAQIMGAAIGLVSAILSPFILMSGRPYLSLIPILVITPMQSVAFTLGNAIVPDICDVDELQTGQRREGLFTSVMAFMAKMEISLCTLAAGYLVSFSGLNVKLIHQAPHVVHNLFWMAIPTALFFAVVSLILTILFPMTEASMTEVRRQLDERRKAQPEAAPVDEGLTGAVASAQREQEPVLA
ncbi:MAG: MFS transporter [Capsulimonadaceae bacterium]|nr:MFS transporter [Capsulimonadaceae bacterium]